LLCLNDGWLRRTELLHHIERALLLSAEALRLGGEREPLEHGVLVREFVDVLFGDHSA
jgi:hypothetical protein